MSSKDSAPMAIGTLRELEAERISEVLEMTKGNISKAAKLLGIHRVTLHRKLAKYEQQALEGRKAS